METLVTLLPHQMFFDPQVGEPRKQAVKREANANPKKEKRLFCAACHHSVTHQDERIPVQGAHEHRCTNPHGITYHIGCFHEAAGCAVSGAATMEYTWFTGHAWRIALCANCRAHLGWRFQSGDDYFHGLIVARLTSTGPVKN